MLGVSYDSTDNETGVDPLRYTYLSALKSLLDFTEVKILISTENKADSKHVV